MPITAGIPVARRIGGFVYAIRNIVARGPESRGGRTQSALPQHRRSDNLRVPNPAASDRGGRAGDARRPQRLCAVGRHPAGARSRRGRMRRRGMPLSADRVILTSGTSEGIELALTALAEAATKCWCRRRPIRSTPRCSRKIGARAVFYRTDPSRGWLPDLDHVRTPDHAGHAGARRHRSEQSDGRDVSGRRAPRADRSRRRHNIPLLADEVYGDLAFDGPVRRARGLDPDAPIISFSSLSKAYLAPGWRAGWMAVGRTERLDDVLGGDQEAGGRPALLRRGRWSMRSPPRSTAIGRTSTASGRAARARAN